MELLDLIINTLSDKLGEQIVSIDMRSVLPIILLLRPQRIYVMQMP